MANVNIYSPNRFNLEKGTFSHFLEVIINTHFLETRKMINYLGLTKKYYDFWRRKYRIYD